MPIEFVDSSLGEVANQAPQAPTVTPGGIDMDTGPTPNSFLIPDAAVQQRAYRAWYGLQSTPAAKPESILRQAMITGKDSDERLQAASTIGLAKQQSNWDQLQKNLSSAGPQGLTPGDLTWITKQAANPIDPMTVFETQFANTYTNELSKFAQTKDEDHFWNVAQREAPDGVKKATDFGYRTMAQNQILDTLSQDVMQKISNQSWAGWGADTLKLMFPLFNPYYEIKMRGNVDGTSFWSGLLGKNLEQQRLALLREPTVEGFATKVKAIADRLAADNPQVALAFLESMKGQSTSDMVLNNINTLAHFADVGALVHVGVGIQRGVKNSAAAINEVRGAVKDAVEASTNPQQSAVNIQSSVGNIAEAAKINAVQNIQTFEGNPAKAAFDRVGAYLTDRANNIRMNPGDLSQPRANILAEETENLRDQFLLRQTEMNKIDRINMDKLLPEHIAQLDKEMTDKYQELPFLGFSDPYRNTFTNAWFRDGYIGKPGGELFFNYNNAKTFAEVQGILNPKIEKKGLGYFIKVSLPIPEDTPMMHDFIVNDARPESKSIYSWLNYQGGEWRTADDTVSAEQRINRKVTVYSQSFLRPFLEAEGKRLSDISRGVVRTDEFGEFVPWYSYIQEKDRVKGKAWKQFNQMLVDLQKQVDTDTGKPGVTLKNPADLKDYYWRTFNRAPTWTEVQGYEAVARLNEYDLILRKIALNRNQSRLGAEMTTVKTLDEKGEAVKSKPFAGIRMTTLPKTGDTIAMIGDVVGQEQLHTLNKLGKKGSNSETWAVTQKRITDGEYRLYRIFDPDLLPLEGFGKIGGERIRYVMVKNAETGPLSWDQINRTGGIHHVYEYDHYAKQAIIRRDVIDGTPQYTYLGDRNLFGVDHRAMGQSAIDGLNEFMRLYREGKIGDAKKWVMSGKTPWEWDELMDKIKPKVVNGKTIPPVLDLHEPVKLVNKNVTIGQMGKELEQRYKIRSGKNKGGFIDGTVTGSDAKAFQIEFTGARDAEDFYGVKDVGTRANPVFKLEQAEMKDPLTTLNRSLSRIIHSNLMDDYKISAIQAWLKEVEGVHKEDISQLRAAPYYYFRTATRDSFVKGDLNQQKLIDTMLANKFKIDQLIGTPHKIDTALHGLAQDIADWSYGRFGPKVAQLTPAWLMPTLKDPFQLVRSWTFHAYLGLFAVPQLFVQNMTWASIYAISPAAATRGSVATILHQISRINQNEKVLAYLDRVASKFGWKPGEWQEAMSHLDRTSFQHVAGEYSSLDRIMAPKVIRNGRDAFLDAGLTPFREGERNVRLGAWYTAFKEWRNEHPTQKITPADRNIILDRADFLYGNMSTASNSFLHTGALSTATQFYAYNIRLAEIFLSGTGRTASTVAERNAIRARLVGTYSLLFGVPGALGLTGLPLGDWIRKQAVAGNWLSFQTGPFQSRGIDTPAYVPGDNMAITSLMEGMGTMLGKFITGNFYNVGQRYGVGGLTQARDILYSDASLWKTIFGASGSLISNTLSNSDGVVMWINSLIHGDKKMYPFNITDAVDFLKEIQTVNRGWMLNVALQQGRWINKNSELVQSDVPAWDAWLRFVTGLNPLEQADSHIKGMDLQDRKELLKYGESKFKQEARRSFIAASKGDYEQANQFMARALLKLEWSGWPPDKMATLFSRLWKEELPITNRINGEFYLNKMNGVSTQRREELRRALTTIGRLQTQDSK